mmetsp:Transcript_1159/g.2573  ORF Transcript_1159/g.2573 Transcript_1159/m.2573 type:complete len:89 (+) Transcript_1159:736-1002(+)
MVKQMSVMQTTRMKAGPKGHRVGGIQAGNLRDGKRARGKGIGVDMKAATAATVAALHISSNPKDTMLGQAPTQEVPLEIDPTEAKLPN